MTIPNIYLIQGLKQNLELANTLQKGLTANFFKHTMYGVKDALSTILALCDLEEMKNIDRVKNNIQRVNGLIEDVALYHSGQVFNARHVLENILNVLGDHYKGVLRFGFEASLPEAVVYAEQSHFEKSLLYIFTQVVEQSKNELGEFPHPIPAEITLLQKGMDMLVTVHFHNERLEPIVRKELLSFANKESFKLLIQEKAQGIEVVLRAPLAIGLPKFDHIDSPISLTVKNFDKKVTSKFEENISPENQKNQFKK